MTKIPGFRSLKRAQLDGLRSHFPLLSDALWEDYRNQIWDDILHAFGWIKALGTARASVLDTEDVQQNRFDQGIQSLVAEVGWQVEELGNWGGCSPWATGISPEACTAGSA